MEPLARTTSTLTVQNFQVKNEGAYTVRVRNRDRIVLEKTVDVSLDRQEVQKSCLIFHKDTLEFKLQLSRPLKEEENHKSSRCSPVEGVDVYSPMIVSEMRDELVVLGDTYTIEVQLVGDVEEIQWLLNNNPLVRTGSVSITTERMPPEPLEVVSRPSLAGINLTTLERRWLEAALLLQESYVIADYELEIYKLARKMVHRVAAFLFGMPHSQEDVADSGSQNVGAAKRPDDSDLHNEVKRELKIGLEYALLRTQIQTSTHPESAERARNVKLPDFSDSDEDEEEHPYHTDEQLDHAKKMCKQISVVAAKSRGMEQGMVFFKLCVVSLFAQTQEDGHITSEIPIFQVGKGTNYVSTDLTYFNSYKKVINYYAARFRGGILYPARLIQGKPEGSSEKVSLEYREAIGPVYKNSTAFLDEVIGKLGAVLPICNYVDVVKETLKKVEIERNSIDNANKPLAGPALIVQEWFRNAKEVIMQLRDKGRTTEEAGKTALQIASTHLRKLNAKLMTYRAREQLIQIVKEIGEASDDFDSWKSQIFHALGNLRKIINLSHFLDTSYETVRETSQLTAEVWSGILFSKETMLLGRSLVISPRMYNNIGWIIVQNSIEKDLLSESKEGNDKVLATLKKVFTRSHEDLDDLFEFVSSFGDKAINREVLCGKLAKVAHFRQEDLLTACAAARDFAQAIEDFDRSFAGVDDDALLKAAEKVRNELLALSRMPKERVPKKERATKDLYDRVRAHSGQELVELQNTSQRYFNDVLTFSNGQNERLSFSVHTYQVRKTLEQALGKGMDDFDVFGKHIFREMSPQAYDRLRRVFDDKNIEVIKEALKFCEDKELAKYVNSADDIACLVELKKLKFKDSKEILKEVIQVESIPSKSPWTSPLSSTYHYLKHNAEHGDEKEKGCSRDDFFNLHSAKIFQYENKFKYQIINQWDAEREAYYLLLPGGSTLFGVAAPKRTRISTFFKVQ